MTLTFVPKLITIGIVLMVAGPWMLQVMIEFFPGTSQGRSLSDRMSHGHQ